MSFHTNQLQQLIDSILTEDDVVNLGERIDVEFKAAQGKNGDGEVPKDLWESYSSMANTNGGVILLGVAETPTEIKVAGIRKVDKVKKELWDLLNNRIKVSINLLAGDDVVTKRIGEKNILVVFVPRASRKERPVFIGTNPLTGTYQRRETGDYRCSDHVVHQMLAEKEFDTLDATILPGFTWKDIDDDSLKSYRNIFSARSPDHPFLTDDMQGFMEKLGAYKRNRETHEEGFTRAGILMFGNYRALHDAFPNYLLDYQEESDNPDIRWNFRLTTDGSWCGNLFEFYRRVYPRITSNIAVPFRLDANGQRINETHIHEAVREAIINSLIHADYSGSIGIMIVCSKRILFFRNPGTLRIPIERIYQGGDSDCRNRTLLKMFQHIGLCEQAGSGFIKILRGWAEQQWKRPLLQEDHERLATELIMPFISFVDESIHQELDIQFGSRWRNLSEDERMILCLTASEQQVTNTTLQRYSIHHPNDLTKLLGGLVSKGFLSRNGQRRGASYSLLSEEVSSSSPILDGSSPILDGSSPILDGSSPILDGSSPILDVSSPILDVSSPILDNSSPILDNSSPILDGSSPILDDSSPILDGSSPILDELPPRLKGLLELAQIRRKMPHDTINIILIELCSYRAMSLQELAGYLNRQVETIRQYTAELVRHNKLALKFPDKQTHPHQQYYVPDELETIDE